jgi:hypothetical protein
MRILKHIRLVVSVTCFALPAYAMTLRLDDSASPRGRVTSSPMMSEQGLPLDQNALAPATTVGVVKFSRIEYKLATAKFVGKQARIYYVIPPFISGLRKPSGLRVDWRGGNVFANGSAQPGERFLVWTGVVSNAYMIDGLDLTMRIDLRELQTRKGVGLAFESYFEIEVFE